MKPLLCLLLLLVPLQAFVSLPGGRFRPFYRVANQAEQVKTVEVAPLVLQRTPVTNRQYLEFVTSNPQWRRSKILRLYAEERYLKHWKDDLHFDADLAESPVCYVSWFAARAYCQSRDLRLPSLLEWEYAAQTNEPKTILDWYSRPTPSRLPPVGSGWRSPNGVCDLHGLVWEWVDDFNSIFMGPESRTGAGLDGGVFCAAGALGSADPGDYAAFMRYGFRSSLKARYCLPNLGFRTARKKGTL